MFMGLATGTRSFPIILKGMDLPKFSGENKAEYEPWRAAFVSVVDVMDIPVGEKDFKAV